MPSYVIESYAAGSMVDAQRERAQLAATLGAGVRYVRTTFLPDEETALHVFTATSSDAVREAAHNVALPYERIVEAVEDSAEPKVQPSRRR